MAIDISVTVATSHIVAMGDLMSAHPSLLDRTLFMYTFHQEFSPNHIQADISLNITQIYNNMTITEVHTPIYILQ
jgi:hypothetical protein